MRKILIPMDFTEVSMNALDYALKIHPESEYTILHVSKGLVHLDEPMVMEPMAFKSDILKAKLLEVIESELGSESRQAIHELMIKEGEIVAEISKVVNEGSYELVIMGTRDKYDFFDRWVGTISLGVVKRIHTPIYLVPRYASFRKFETVLVASDYKPENIQTISLIKRWNQNYKAFIKFLHVSRKPNEIVDKDLIINTLFAGEEPEFGFEIATVHDKDVSHSILNSAYNSKADLMIVIPENKSFIQSLLFKSLSKDLILKSSIPILFIHKGDHL